MGGQEDGDTMKIVCPIAFAGWRVGSSLVTGLVANFGAYVRDKTETPHKLCARGFFEDGRIIGLQQRTCDPYWKPYRTDITTEELIKRSFDFKNEINEHIDNKLLKHDAYVFKCMMGMAIPILNERKDIKVKIVHLQRNLDDETDAITAVFCKTRKKAPLVKKWLKWAQKQVRDIVALSVHPVLHVTFEEFLIDPIRSSKKLCEFVELNWPGEAVIQQFIQPKSCRHFKRGKHEAGCL